MSSSSSSASLVNEDLITTISGLISLIHEERQRVDGILELSHLDDHIITIHQNELEDYKIIINKLTQELSNQTIKLINKNNLLKYYERQDRDQLTNKEEESIAKRLADSEQQLNMCQLQLSKSQENVSILQDQAKLYKVNQQYLNKELECLRKQIFEQNIKRVKGGALLDDLTARLKLAQGKLQETNLQDSFNGNDAKFKCSQLEARQDELQKTLDKQIRLVAQYETKLAMYKKENVQLKLLPRSVLRTLNDTEQRERKLTSSILLVQSIKTLRRFLRNSSQSAHVHRIRKKLPPLRVKKTFALGRAQEKEKKSQANCHSQLVLMELKSSVNELIQQVVGYCACPKLIDLRQLDQDTDSKEVKQFHYTQWTKFQQQEATHLQKDLVALKARITCLNLAQQH